MLVHNKLNFCSAQTGNDDIYVFSWCSYAIYIYLPFRVDMDKTGKVDFVAPNNVHDRNKKKTEKNVKKYIIEM